jgi:plastocyanin
MLRLLGLCLLCVALTLGCGGSDKRSSPATATPAVATATPAAATATMAPSATPLPTDTPEPTSTPTATPAPEPTEPPLPSAVTVTAQRLAYLNPNAVAKAGQVTLTLQNLDTSVPHDISIDGLGVSVDCSGPCTESVAFTAPAGSYAFHCSYHPYMTGTLTLVP